jgi:membrane protease YdiL (CAAX protease family)
MKNAWAQLPILFRAVTTGLLIGLVPANVWPPLLLSLGLPLAATTEAAFLALYLWWASGAGPPLASAVARRAGFRLRALTPMQWMWGVVAALSFAAAIHASIVLLFRFVPFSTEAFRHDYNAFFNSISSLSLKWIAVVVSAASAGICEETGFRGYMQQPIEQRHGAPTAIVVSSVFFTLLHLTKSWALVGMVPVVFIAGVLLGFLAWSSGSLIPGIIGHVVMDIGLFAYWWTGIAGDFTARPITETGIDPFFLATSAILGTALGLVLVAARRLRRLREVVPSDPAPGGTEPSGSVAPVGVSRQPVGTKLEQRTKDERLRN